MRYLASFVVILFFGQFMNSQTYEVGLMLGGSNYIGDVGSTYYIAPNALAIGASIPLTENSAVSCELDNN